MVSEILTYIDPIINYIKTIDFEEYESLKKAHRLDLVGFGKNCLIRPRAKDNNSKINITKSKKKSKKR